MPKRAGMIVHGLKLTDEEWKRIIWGEPPYLLGRATKALLLLLDEYPQVEKVLFGSGNSQRAGMKEGTYTLKLLLAEWSRLQDFEVFKYRPAHEMDMLRNRLERIAEPEIESHNTLTELEHGIPRLFHAGCRRIVLVTEPTHISRAYAHGFEVLSQLSYRDAVSLVAEHSDLNPKMVDPSQVVVFEPRADGKNEIVPNLRRIFRIPAEKRGEFNEKFAQALTDVGV